MFDKFFNALFGWGIDLNPLFGIIFITFVITLLITLAYKFFSDQAAIKRLKDEMKILQKDMKVAKDDVEKMKDHQKNLMAKQFESFKHNIKPMIITFIPIILIFGWLGGALSYEPLLVGKEFSVEVVLKDSSGVELVNSGGLEIVGEEKSRDGLKWILKGDKEGEYNLDFKYGEGIYPKDIIITKGEREFADAESRINVGGLNAIRINYEKLKLFFGLGWLGSYIIFSICFSFVLRKLLKVH